MIDLPAQRGLLCLCLSGTLAVLLADWLLFRTFGPDYTISWVTRGMFDRWPVTWVIFVLWIGILIGHLMPVKV